MLDERDQIIFEHLLANARIQNKELARILGCSEATVIKRIKRLEKEQYIIRYDALVNWQAVPLLKAAYFLNMDDEKALRRVHEHKSVFAIFRLLGPANTQVWCFFRTRKQQKAFERTIAPHLQKKLAIEELTFPPSAFFEVEPKPAPYSPATNDVAWSRVSVAIMKHMAMGHARQSFYEMSKELKIPYDTVHYHGRKLLTSGAIGRMLPQLGTAKFGLTTTVLVIGLGTADALERALQNIHRAKRINSVARCEDNALLVLVVSTSHQDFLSTLQAITKNVQTEVKELQQYYWREMVLNNRYPLEELL